MISKIGRKKKGSWQAILTSLLLGGLILTMVSFLIISNWRISQRRAELQARIETLKKEIQALEQRNQELQARILQISQPEYLEKEARERFNLKKPGEEVVTILPPKKREETKKEEKKWWNPFTW